MKYIIGIDNGGTGVKAVMFDLEGREIASANEKIRILTPREFFVERDMDEVWEKNLLVIKRVLEDSGVKPEDVIAIGQSGHGKGLYLLGEDDKVIYNAIHSNDSRANDLVLSWKENGIIEEFNKNYQNPVACQLPALLKWMDDNTNVLDKAKYIMGVKDYIAHKLTGNYFHEITDFSSSAMVNFSDNTINFTLLEKLGLEKLRDKFSSLIKSTDVYGNISEKLAKETGLSTECKVTAGVFDISACSIAMGIVDGDYLSLIGGTWSINGFISNEAKFGNGTTQNSIYCIDDYYYVEESSPTSASNNEWFINTFLSEKVGNVYEFVNKLIEGEAFSSNGPIYCPFLYGSNYNRVAKAGLVDLNSSDSLAAILRSVYEGVAFAHKVHVDKLLALKDDFKAIRVAGGIVNSDIWLEIFANVLAMPLEIIDKKELGAFGAALAAGIGVGVYPDFETATNKLVKVTKRIEPDKEMVLKYGEKFKRYLEVAEFLE